MNKMSVQANSSLEGQSESEASPSPSIPTSASSTLPSPSSLKPYQSPPKMAVKFFKTKLCPWYSQGRCRLGNNCNWAHNMQEVRDSVDLSRTKLCHHLATQGKCTDPACRFAHRREELRATTDVYKTSLCVFWMRGGCFIGQKCRYAHGLNDLRHHSGYPAHRLPCRSPDLLLLDSAKERDTECCGTMCSVSNVDRMGWNDPSLAAVAHAMSLVGARVSTRSSPPAFETRISAPAQSASCGSSSRPSSPEPRSTRQHPQSTVSPSLPRDERAITQEELMTAMEALQSLLKVSTPSPTSCPLSPPGVPLSSCGQHTTPHAPVLPRSSHSTPQTSSDRLGDSASSRLLAVAQKMTDLEFASRPDPDDGFPSAPLDSSVPPSETHLKDVIDTLTWMVPCGARDSESHTRTCAKRLEEADVRSRLGIVQELKAAAILSVVAANAALTTAEDLNTQVTDMISVMRSTQLPWSLVVPSRNNDDQTTSVSTHLGSGSERTDSVSNVSWRSNIPLDDAAPIECTTRQEDTILGQVLDALRRTQV